MDHDRYGSCRIYGADSDLSGVRVRVDQGVRHRTDDLASSDVDGDDGILPM